MRAGLMTERVEILKPIRIKDEYGAERVGLKSKGFFWANVTSEIDGREIGGDRILYTNIVTFKMRTLIPLASDDIIRYDGVDYRILSHQDKKIGDYKEVRATETDSYGFDTNIC